MKKCNIYLNFVNSDNFDDSDNQAFKDVLAHSEQCTDCSFDRKIRENMLCQLANTPEPNYPTNLHEIAFNDAIDKKTESKIDTDWLSNLIIGSLKPIEIGVSFACIIMFVFLFQINHSSDNSLVVSENNQPTGLQKMKILEANENISEDGLQKVSPEEVKEFLAKLEEFQRLHPESKTSVERNRPIIRLVGDKR